MGYVTDADAKRIYTSCLAKLKLYDLDRDIELVLKNRDIIVKNYKYRENGTSVCIPYGITVLGDGCFSGTNIVSIRLSSSIEVVGYGCFANCPKLEKIYIHEEQIRYKEVLGYGNKAEIIVIQGVHWKSGL